MTVTLLLITFVLRALYGGFLLLRIPQMSRKISDVIEKSGSFKTQERLLWVITIGGRLGVLAVSILLVLLLGIF